MPQTQPIGELWSFFANAQAALDKVNSASLDANTGVIVAAFNGLLAGLATIQRSDNLLMDQCVSLRCLGWDVIALLASKGGWIPHQPVLLATTGTSLTLSGEQTIDGVLTSSSRVLVKDQANQAQNGIYVTGSGAWTLAYDWTAQQAGLAYVGVEQGTDNTNTAWLQIVPQPITIGTTGLIFYAVGGAGGVLALLQGGTGVTAPANWPAPSRLLVRVVGVANLNINSPGAAIDGVTLAAGDRVLLVNQTIGIQNGLWTFATSTTSLIRSLDYPSGGVLQAFKDMLVQVREGAACIGSTWRLATSGAISIDGTATVWVIMSGTQLQNRTALKTVPSALIPNGTVVSLLGYANGGDGGGAPFEWNATDTTADNGGTICESNDSGTGRWHLVYSGPTQGKWFGVTGNSKMVLDAAITSGMSTLSSSSAGFLPTDVGKTVYVMGAGASGAVLMTTISAYISATQVTLTATAGTTVSSATCTYGNDDTAALTASIAWASLNGTREVRLPFGNYLLGGQLVFQPNVMLIGYEHITNDWTQMPQLFMAYGSGTSNPGILLDISCGIKGFSILYPNQVAATSSTPTVYGYAIELNQGLAYNIDNVRLTDLFLVNPYRGLSLVKGARWQVERIYGNPLSCGIECDQNYDECRMQNVHFWDWYASSGSNLYAWVQANGRAFWWNRVDGVHAFDLFAYGYNECHRFDNVSGNGGCWGTFVACDVDVCNIPMNVLTVQTVTFIGGRFDSFNAPDPVVITSVGFVGTFRMVGCEIWPVAAIGILNSSANGRMYIDSCDFFTPDNHTNGCLWVPIVVESTGETFINNCGYGFYSDFFWFSGFLALGGPNVVIDGIPNPSADQDMAPANFNMGTWSAGVPNDWSFAQVGGQTITQITDGCQFNLVAPGTGVNTSILSFAFPQLVQDYNGLYLLEFDYTDYTVSTGWGLSFKICRPDGSGQRQWLGTSSEALNTGKTVHFKVPVFFGLDTGSGPCLFIQWFTEAGISSGNFQIANLKLSRQCPPNAVPTAGGYGKETNRQIEAICSRIYQNPYGQGITHSIQNGCVFNRAAAPPTTGTWAVGDTILNVAPAAGQAVGWRCISAGTFGGTAPVFAGYGYVTVKGVTSARPTLQTYDVGATYLDTTLAAGGEPITWDGAAWRNYAGTSV